MLANTDTDVYTESDRHFYGRVRSAAIQLCVLAGWVSLCVHFVAPFFFPVVWAGIIATAVYPLVRMAAPGRPKLGATLFLVASLAIVLIPAWFLVQSALGALASIGQQLAQGHLKLPEPNPRVGEWPLIGPRVLRVWHEAVDTPSELAARLAPQLRAAGGWLIRSVGHLLSALGQSVIAVILATMFLARPEACSRGLTRVAERLVPEHGASYIALAGATIRSVAQGVLGIAIAQSLLAALGLVVARVPGTGLWALLVLVVAVMQLPPLLILGPIAVYVFSAQGSLTGTLFLIWSLAVSASDGFLKPFLLARGVSVPTLVVLLGAIGGVITNGIIGLFVGAVVVAVAYELGRAWLGDTDKPREAPSAPQAHEDTGSTPAPPMGVEQPATHH